MSRKPAKRHFFRQQDALVTKTTTDIGSNDTDTSVIKAQALRHATPHDMGHLRSTVDDELLKPCIPLRNNAATFNRCHALPCCPEFSLDLDGRTRRNRQDIANIDKTLKEYVVAPFVVN